MAKRFDWWMIAAVAILISIGLAMLYAFSGSAQDQHISWISRQLLWVAIGIGVFLFFSSIDYRFLTTSKQILAFAYLGILAVLGAVLVFGKTISGHRAWFALGTFTLQPVEFAKIVLVLVLARYFSQKNLEIWQFRHIIISACLLGGIAGLVLLQPDTGSTLILVGIWFFMLLLSGVRMRQVLILGLVFMLLFGLGWFKLFNRDQKSRIMALVNPNQDPLGAAYSQRQAQIAIGSGGLWGKGLGKGTQTQLGFLPASRTDFIFASVGEELGFVGIFLICASYVVLLWRLLAYAMNAPNNFVRLFSAGLASAIFLQAAFTISMNIGILPVIGVGLPFVSYSGSNLLALFSGLGIIQSMRTHS